MGTGIFLALNLAARSMGATYPVPLSVVAIELLGSAVLLIGFRIAVRSVYERFQTERPTPVIIFGAGEAGIITKQAVERPSADTLRVIAFLDDDPAKHGKRIDGAPIHPADDAARILAEFGAKRLIVSIPVLDPARKAFVIDAALDAGLRVMDVPPAQRWIQGELSAGQLRDTRIEGLLGRPVIELDASAIAEHVQGARVPVTEAPAPSDPSSFFKRSNAAQSRSWPSTWPKRRFTTSASSPSPARRAGHRPGHPHRRCPQKPPTVFWPSSTGHRLSRGSLQTRPGHGVPTHGSVEHQRPARPMSSGRPVLRNAQLCLGEHGQGREPLQRHGRLQAHGGARRPQHRRRR